MFLFNEENQTEKQVKNVPKKNEIPVNQPISWKRVNKIPSVFTKTC